MRMRRDTVLVTAALAIGAVNMIFFGGLATTYGFALGVLASPAVMRYDEARREADR